MDGPVSVYPALTMPSGHPHRLWRRFRVYFRRFRIAVWVFVLLVLGTLLYLNQAGLPNFIKQPLLDKLRARGIELRFSRIHLSLARGIVAENVVFGPTGEQAGPEINFAQLVVGLNLRSLLRGQAQLDNLALRRGRLVWPIAETNRPPRRLVLDDVQTDLRFLPDDQWALDNFHATFAATRIQLAGRVTHASAVRDWGWLQSRPAPETSNPWPNRLREIADALELVRFQGHPDLRLDVDGDARDPWSFSLRFFANAPDAQTPWGTVVKARFIARLYPATNNQMSRAELSLTAANAQTRWANITNFNLKLSLASIEGQTNLPAGEITLQASDAYTPWATAANLDLHLSFTPFEDRLDELKSDLRLSVQNADSRWGQATNLHLTAQGVHSITNPIPLSASARMVAEQVQTRWGRARLGTTVGHFATVSIPAMPFGPGATVTGPGLPLPPPPPWYAAMEPYAFDWDCQLTDFASHDVAAEVMACQGSWRMPSLVVTNLHARLGQGKIDLGANWDVMTDAVQATLTSDADPTRFTPILSERVGSWLKQATWPAPPQLALGASLVLPSLTNTAADWFALAQPSLTLSGKLNLPQGAEVKGISVLSAETGFCLSNGSWGLSDLALTRPEGRLLATHQANLRSKAFHSQVSSTIDPRAMLPLLPAEAREAFALLTLSTPPVIGAEVWGNLDHLEQLGARGELQLTNFAFRGETATGLQTRFQYTNQYLEFLNPHIQFGSRQIMADALVVDLPRQLLYLTNGSGSADPMAFTRAIGPQVAQALAPFQFRDPPTVRGHGTIPLEGTEAADLFFEVEGTQFHWLCFDVPAISGNIHWAGFHLTLSQVQTEFYEGAASGSAALFFSPTNPGTDYSFTLTTINTDLKKLMTAVFGQTNRLEGRLNGTLVITNANSEDWRQTGGFGAAHLQDGLIWDIPLFGIFSKPLDTIALGIGTSRVSAGDCTFIITNGVIRSDNLELRSPALSLFYHGTTDLEGRVNARVEAELLRGKPLVGPLFSLVLWPVTKLFEYKLTGLIADPKTELLNPIPRLIFLPLHPFRTIKSLFPEEPKSSHTNHSPATATPAPPAP